MENLWVLLFALLSSPWETVTTLTGLDVFSGVDSPWRAPGGWWLHPPARTARWSGRRGRSAHPRGGGGTGQRWEPSPGVTASAGSQPQGHLPHLTGFTEGRWNTVKTVAQIMGKRTSWLLQLNYFRYWEPSEALSILSSHSPPIALLIISKFSLENYHSESNRAKQWKVSLNNATSWTWGRRPTLCAGVCLQEADSSGSILQDIPRRLSAGTRVCACGQGGSRWGPETACPWCQPGNIRWRARQVLWGIDTARCAELLQKSVPWGTTGLQ